MKDELDINLRIGDVALRMTIDRSEEELLREAAGQINIALEKWRKKFANRSNRELMAMVTLLFAKAFLIQRKHEDKVDTTLADFEDELDNLLLRLNDGTMI
ncbi:MAG: cell division protein ZapA [Muribaculaceae bacterium]|nr:cell division protein ZapA [Muribaculaceae bacterium]